MAITDNDYKRLLKNNLIGTDAKAYLSEQLSTDEYKYMRELVGKMSGIHTDDVFAETNLWRLNAEVVYSQRIKNSAKDFVPYKTIDQVKQGEWLNNESEWPPIAIYRDGKNFDPFGLRQSQLSQDTIRERNTSIRYVYGCLKTETSFYVPEYPFYPWLEDVSAIANIVQQDPCDEKCCACRNFNKLGSIVKMFCRALGRQDLCDKYSTEFVFHGGNLIDGSVVAIQKPKRKLKEPVVPKIQALHQDVQDQIVVFANKRLQDCYAAMLASPIELFDEFFDNYVNKTDAQRRNFRKIIRSIMEPATDYLILAFMYTEMRPLRNDLVNIRFHEAGLDTSKYGAIKVTDTTCTFTLPSTNKKYEKFASPDLSGTPLHKFLVGYLPFASSIQEEFLRSLDGCIQAPHLLCTFDHTRTYIDETEKSPNKRLLGSKWTGLVNYRPSMFKKAGIDIPKRHSGCIAARHTSVTNDAMSNAGIVDPKERLAAKRQQAHERNHAVSTAEACYEDVQQLSPKTKKSKITVVETNE